MDFETRFRLEYNRREIEKKIRNLSATVFGHDASILPYITDKSGKISDRAIDAFIRELLSGGKWDVDGISIENEHILSEEDERFFGAFFYCSIRCYANDLMSRYAIYEPFEACTTFRHILDKAALAQRDIRFRSYEALLKNEYHNLVTQSKNGENMEFYPLSGFFATMDHCYCFITGDSVESIDEGRFRIVAESTSDPGRMYRDDLENSHTIGANKKDSLTDEEMDAISSAALAEYEEREARIRRTNAERVGAWEMYKNSFGSADKFLALYRQYRKLFFDTPKNDIYGRVESMCTDFLYRKGLLPYVDDDDLTCEIVDLERATSNVNYGIRRRERNG